jgi:hypothetical protein
MPKWKSWFYRIGSTAVSTFNYGWDTVPEGDMAWLGRKKLAFIPLSRTNIQPPDIIPTDWPDLIMQRLFFDPAKNTITRGPIAGTDLSLRAYFHTVSSGLADLDVVVLPPETIAEEGVPPDALEATMGNQLRAEGFDGAAIVMLGGPGGGSTAQLSNFAWSRFCMSDNLGAWVGEIMHQTNLCDLPDLFDWAGQYPSGAKWVLLSRRLAISPLIPVPGQNGQSAGSILRLFRCTWVK